MSNIVYCLKKRGESEEYHLFICTLLENENKCNCDQISICKKMNKSESTGPNIFSCEKEDPARLKSAQRGRKVCGVCVSHLYETNYK